MDIYTLLQEDHEKVKSLFDELEETTERALKKRAHLFSELKMELEIHALAEEKYFYPLLKEDDSTHEMALEAVEEHAVVKRLLKELEKDDKGTEEWAAKLKVLKENVEHHVGEEEGDLFKKAKQVIGKDIAEQLAEEVEAFKEEQILAHGS
jgi:iron-sulfur cluster repair protein YtfE (RIC family)